MATTINASNEADMKDTTPTTPLPVLTGGDNNEYQQVGNAETMEPMGPGDDGLDTMSIYPTGNYRSMPRSYDLESLTSTRSLYEKELNYVMENGRRYTGQYFAPNDEIEQDRLHITHQTYLFLFDNQLTTVPLENPSRILDIGTGTGDWAIGMGELYPDAEVIGTDLSAIQRTSTPSSFDPKASHGDCDEEHRVGLSSKLILNVSKSATAIPTNVYFEIDDAEDETGWTFPPSSFDLIHLRSLAGCFQSWPSIYASCLATLRPGGWIEVIDFDDWMCPSFSSYFSPTSPIHDFLGTIKSCCEKIGRPRSQAHLSIDMLRDIGFAECFLKRWEAPIGNWPKDEGGRGMGKLWLLAILEGFEALGLRLLTKEAGWSAQEVMNCCQRLREELMGIVKSGKGDGMAAGVKVLTGRKPFTDEDTTRGKQK